MGKGASAEAAAKRVAECCRVCQSDADRSGKRDFWLGCSGAGCDYWVHSKCARLYFLTEKECQSAPFFCTLHGKIYLRENKK